jgi:serine/threonine protein kinase
VRRPTPDAQAGVRPDEIRRLSARSLIGQVFCRRFEIVAPIAAGGMGKVYRALDTRLNRTVALKLLSPDRMADEQRKRRFLQEARAASALNHPHGVAITMFSRWGHRLSGDGVCARQVARPRDRA